MQRTSSLVLAFALALTAPVHAGGSELFDAWVAELDGENPIPAAEQLSAAWNESRGTITLALEKHPSAQVRSWCVRIVREHQGEVEDRMLARTAIRDRIPRVRSLALKELASRPGPQFRSVAEDRLAWETDQSSLFSLLGLVERRGDASLIGALLEASENRFDASLQHAAFGVLRKLSGAPLPPEFPAWKAWWKTRLETPEQVGIQGED